MAPKQVTQQTDQDLFFDPTMPFALALPWPGKWAECRVRYDLYKCEEFLDDQTTYMAESFRARRPLDARLKEIEALPDEGEKEEQRAVWNVEYRAWRRENCLLQIAYFVQVLELPNGQEAAADNPATWARFPMKFLEWIVDDGYALARAELWDPKSQTPSMLPTPSDS
jgi:hypothetical protein